MTNFLFKNTFRILVALLLVFSSCQTESKWDQPLPDRVDFNFHIKPILSDRCFMCHGPDENARKADFRLDIQEAAFAPLDSASDDYAIVPGSLKKSQLIDRLVSTDPDYMMPPPESNLSLSAYEIALLERWIEQGAEWKPHWSFMTPQKPTVPEVKHQQVYNEIDNFIIDGLHGTSLKQAEPESKQKLLRRLSFDLTGLPPTIQQLETFLSDDAPDAYEKQVDRLLASPAYGERMTAIWLEAARYADSHGYQDDRPRTIWPWRDWVIDAFNENMPYNDFITWQLAGDLLPEPTYEQKLATAFNRNHAITQEGGVINEEYVTEYVADRTNTTAAAFMGLTMECARCHDHKYDPISQKDYYQMFAFFNGIDERGQVSYFDLAPVPNMRVEDEELEATIAMLDSLRDQKEAELKAYVNGLPYSDFQQWRSGFDASMVEESLEQGLITYFKLDELVDLTARNAVPGGLQGQANIKIISELASPEIVPGRYDQALKFDGKNYLSLGDVGDFEASDRFSLGAFVKPLVYPDKKAGLLVRRNGEQKQAGYELVLDTRGRLSGALIHDQKGVKTEVHTRQALPLNRWTHVFMTYDGSGRASGISLFLNGVRQSVVTVSDQLDRKSILNGNDLLVGNWTPRRANSKAYFGFENGAIDEVRVYDRQLSDVEVATLMGSRDSYSEMALQQYYLLNVDRDYAKRHRELDSLRGIYLEVPHIMIMQEMDTPRVTHILDRGVYDAPLEVVTAGAPSAIMPFRQELPKNRLGLAQWLTSPENPLTARVAVNRFWQMMFGRGLVNTPEDFGNQGDLPSHPELLDWLAVTFVESDWDVKALLKMMAMSYTYQQAAKIAPNKLKIDPQNVLLARGPSGNLEAEMLRDQALAASGLLHQQVGGKWVKPYQPPGIWKELANQIGENKYRTGSGTDLYRRSLYTYWKRTIPPPFMLTFDASERAVCVLKRQSTSTPLQALEVLNDPVFIEASRVLAQEVMRVPGDPSKWIEAMFLSLTSRPAEPEEMDNLTSLYHQEFERYQDHEQMALALLSVGEAPVDQALPAPDLAALTVIANVIMNLDEAKMKS